MMPGIRGLLIASCAAFTLAPAAAQPMTVAIGRVATTQSCSYFQNSAGKAAMVASPWVVASASSWRTWWVKDCVANFATMRSSLESALAASGALRVGSRGAHYTVSINITNVAGADARPTPEARPTNDFSIAQNWMVVSMNVTVTDAAGRAVFGGLLTKKIEVGSDVKVGGFEASRNESGEAAYGRMQNEIALAAARMVAFHFTPIQVTGVDGNEVQLNYGTPLLQLGSLVSISTPDHRATARYRVVSPSASFSTAEADGGSDPRAIVPGSIGTFIEPDSDEANARRMKRVDLP